MDKIRDRIWMYAAVPGAYHTPHYALPGVSTLRPSDACRRLGLTKAVMDVTMKGPEYPFDQCSEELAFLDELVWTIIPSGGVSRNINGFFDMEEVIRQIQKYSNITGVFCDDFNYRRRSAFSPENLQTMKDKVLAASDRKLKMWMVMYNYELFSDSAVPHRIWTYGEPVDVVSFWSWHPFYLKVLPEHLEFLAGRWPDKEYNLGVYLWDFSKGKPLSDELMQLQLDTMLKLFREGQLDSVSLCSNCIMGLGIKAEDMFLRWLDRYGEEEIASRKVVREAAVDNERL